MIKENMLAVTAECNQKIDAVWKYWSEADHIKNWYYASPDWYVPHVSNDFNENADFLIRMAAKDGSVSFDLRGTYTRIIPHEFVEYYLEDGRKVLTLFQQNEDKITIYQEFEAEVINPAEVQIQGWKAILDNFVHYAESL